MASLDQRYYYTVYDNHTDLPLIVCATSEECAKAMGVTVKTFHGYLTPSGKAREKRWTIVSEGLGYDLFEPKTMGQYMRRCRLKKGLRITQLQELTGIHATLIKGYENDRVYAGVMNLISIADALDVSIDELIGRSRK